MRLSNRGFRMCGIMSSKRPVNLDLFTIRFPLPAITSIMHRISGAFLFPAVGGLLYLLELSLASESGFAEAGRLLDSLAAKALLWLVLSALAYHFIAGCRHLLMDLGIGESLAGGLLGARLILLLSVLAAVGLGVWLW